MSLANCSECGHQVSLEAIVCPNCGHPFAPKPTPVANPRVIVAEPKQSEFPMWVLIPVVIVGAIVLFVMIAMFQNKDDDEATRRVGVNLDTSSQSDTLRETRTTSPPNQVEVPSSSTTITTAPPSSTTTTTTAPQTIPPSTQTEVVNAPPTKGEVLVEAKISTATGSIQSVKDEKFYLLDKDLESILRDANLMPIKGQTLLNSFGLAITFPDRHGDFRRNALNAINKHIKYNATTDSNGKASMKNVEPDSYYLFGITTSRNGFAVWSSPVSIVGGENKLNLSPARLTEVSE